jgi:hypothetical protein
LRHRPNPERRDVDSAIFIGAMAMTAMVATWAQFFGMDITGFDRAMRPVIDNGFGTGDERETGGP